MDTFLLSVDLSPLPLMSAVLRFFGSCSGCKLNDGNRIKEMNYFPLNCLCNKL